MTSTDDKIPPEPSNVTQLRPPKPAPKLTIIHEARFCFHDTWQVNENRRIVKCGRCGAELDPVSVISSIARDWQRITLAQKHAKDEIRTVSARLKLLERLESNARARAKRQGIKTSKDQLDQLVRWVSAKVKRPMTPEAIDLMFGSRPPSDQIKSGLQALEDGALEAALCLLRSGVDGVEAAIKAANQVRAEELGKGQP